MSSSGIEKDSVADRVDDKIIADEPENDNPGKEVDSRKASGRETLVRSGRKKTQVSLKKDSAKNPKLNSEQRRRGLWETLNAEYPWVKVAIALTALLLALSFWRLQHLARPVYVVETRGLYAELGLKPPMKKKRNLEGKKLIALTFDDGPSLSTTPRLLDILRDKKAPATFFVLGTMARNYPDIVKREAQEGHEVGSHTTWHQNLPKLSVEEIEQDMNESCRILTEINGKCADLVRPPYGAIDDKVARGLGRPLVIWSVDTEDWKSRNADKIRAEVRRSNFDGAVILFHDTYNTTVDSIPVIIDDLRAAGYEFVTISEMAEARGVVMEKGGVYGIFRP